MDEKIQDWIKRMGEIQKEMAEEANMGQAQTRHDIFPPRTLSDAALRLAYFIRRIEAKQYKEERAHDWKIMLSIPRKPQENG